MFLHRAKAPAIAGCLLVLTSVVVAQEEEESRGAAADEAERAYDRIVDQFIQYDIGRVYDPGARRSILESFGRLKSADAIPALVRGLNKSLRMRASCPISALADRVRGILRNSSDPEAGMYVLRNLRSGRQTHPQVTSVMRHAEQQVLRTMGKQMMREEFERRTAASEQRLVSSPDFRIRIARQNDVDAALKVLQPTADNASAEAPGAHASEASVAPDRVSLDELLDQLAEAPAEQATLDRLFEQATTSAAIQKIAGHAAEIIETLRGGTPTARAAAARLLGLLRSEDAVAELIDCLEHPDESVRSAAATALARITRQLYGPRDDATPEERSRSIAKWRAWLARQNGTSSAE